MVFPHPLPLVPAPVTSQASDGRMPLTPSTRVSGPTATVTQFINAVERRSGIRLGTSTTDGAEIVLRIDSSTAALEGYSLTISDRAEVVGSDDAGLFYGVQTLLQLLRQEADGAWGLLRGEVTDAPRFTHRGVMLDVARHFFDVADVKKYIDATSALKFNHLHLHLSDDQGWRIHIDSWPKLTEQASSSDVDSGPGGFYSKSDYREIVAYAASRHMIVIPEIDLPGHTHAIGVAYPELVEAPVLSEVLIAESAERGQDLPVAGEHYTGWGVGHSSVRIHDERTYDFIRDVVREIADVTPGAYIHIGGDESLGTVQADFDVFAARVTEIVIAAGKIPVGWHELGSAPELADGTVGQYWGSTAPDSTQAANVATFVEHGGALILSPSNAAYLDMKPASSFPLGLEWAGIIDLQAAYGWEPTSVLDVPDSAILGVEAPLWSETAQTIADIEQLAFPRAAAIAEIAWSPRAALAWNSFRERAGALAPVWNADDVNFHRTTEIDWSER